MEMEEQMTVSIPSLLFNAESFYRIKSFSYNRYMDNCNLLKSTRVSVVVDDECVDEVNGHDETDGDKSNSSLKSIDCFFKSFQFAPDGCAAVSWTECNNKFQIWNLKKYCQTELYHSKYFADDNSVSSDEVGEINPNNIGEYFHEIQSGESIYDCKWYPYASSTDLSSFCFASSSRDHPIHIWDATTSKLRCSYIGYNQYDEIDPAMCISFNLFGDKIYAGSNRMIRCFDVANPGVYSNIPTCKSRRDPMGQKGIISTISFNPDYSKSYAVGSYASSVGIYVENMEGCALEIRDIGMDVTCIKWSPNGNNIWVGGRKNNNILCWDVRNTRSELGKVHRLCTSNQKMMFDIDPWGNFLCTGTQEGSLLIYDVNNFNLIHEISCDSDCINIAQFHPFSSLIGAATGQRHFIGNDSDSDCDSNSDSNSINNIEKPSNYCFDLYKFAAIK